MNGCTIGSHSLISYSVVGKDTSIRPHVTTLLGKSVMKVDDLYAQKENIGSFIGGVSHIGSHVVIEPGTRIGRSCEIAPLKVIQKNLASGSKVM
jgi:NDP-sugar pyrophosphorylase family protein